MFDLFDLFAVFPDLDSYKKPKARRRSFGPAGIGAVKWAGMICVKFQLLQISSIHSLLSSGSVEKTSVLRMGPTIRRLAMAENPLDGSRRSPGTMYRICRAILRHPRSLTAGVMVVGCRGTLPTGSWARSPERTLTKKLDLAASMRSASSTMPSGGWLGTEMTASVTRSVLVFLWKKATSM